MINKNCVDWEYYEFYRKLGFSDDSITDEDILSVSSSSPSCLGDPVREQAKPEDIFRRELNIEFSSQIFFGTSNMAYSKVLKSCIDGDYNTFATFAQQNYEYNDDYTRLIIKCISVCIVYGRRDILSFIFTKYPKSIIMCDDNGNYPMHWAQNPETVNFLISCGAYLHPHNEVNGNTPLHTLISYGNLRTAFHIMNITSRNLVEKYLNIKNSDGDTPLSLACLFGRFDIIGELLKKGADYRTLNKLNLTPMHMAALGNHENVMRYLVGLNDVKYQLKERDIHGNTPKSVCIAFNGSHHDLAWACIEMEGKLVDFSFIREMVSNDFIGTEIGSGSFGNVYRPHSAEYSMYAIKEVVIGGSEPAKYEKNRNRFITEICLMDSFEKSQKKYFPTLVFAAKRDENHYYFVTQFFGKGNLSELIKAKNQNSDITVNYIVSEIANGMCILHSHVPHIIHRDLTTKNIMIDDDYTIKICDFGISRYKVTDHDIKMSLIGKKGYVAPEVYSKKRSYNLSVDSFFFGHVLYEIMHGKQPFSEDTEGQDKIKRGEMPNISDDVEECWKDLILKCWSAEPSERPTFAQIANMAKSFPIKKLKDCISLQPDSPPVFQRLCVDFQPPCDIQRGCVDFQPPYKIQRCGYQDSDYTK